MDLDQGTTAETKSRTRLLVAVIAIAATVIAVALIVSALLVRTQPAAEAPAVSAPAQTPPAPTPAPPTPTPVASDQAPAEAWSALTAFLDGWRSPDLAVRARIFEATATKALTDGLMDTAPEKRLVAPILKVEVTAVTPYTVTYRVWFVDVAAPVKVLLVNDPGSPHGWRVNTIERFA